MEPQIQPSGGPTGGPSGAPIGFENAGEAIANTGTSITNTVTDAANSFSDPSQVNTTSTSFLDSNGIIAKFVFLILVIIIFVILFFLIVKLIGYFSKPAGNPMLINGQINASKKVVISQNPASKTAIPIQRSNNQATGIEFTWCVWLSLSPDGVGNAVTPTWHSPIFVKGDASLPNNGVNPYCSMNNGPGVYFGTPSEPNHLYILMDTVDTAAINSPNLVIDISNLPTNYFHLAVRCQNTFMDVYINGTLVKRHNLMNVPKQNYYDINVCPYNGYNGLLSNLQYFSKALNVIEINHIVRKGPNTKDVTQSSYHPALVNSISTSWYNSFL
jgi:hypothetical protein